MQARFATIIAVWVSLKPTVAQHKYEFLSTDSSQLPEGRYAMGYGQRTSVNDGKLYLFGGIGDGYSTRSDILVFDYYNNKQISTVSNVNTPCGIQNWNECCVNHNDKTYMTHFNTIASSDPDCNKFLWIFDYTTNQFSFSSDPEGYVLQPCLALDQQNERIFVSGHFDDYDNDIPYSYPAKRMQIYDINSNSWTTIPAAGSPGQYCPWVNATHSYCIHQQRSSHTCMYHQDTDKLWIFGGRNAQNSDKLSSVEYFDFISNLWIKNTVEHGSMHIARAWARMASFLHYDDAKVYWIIIGGQGESPGAGYLVEEIEIFDPLVGQFVNLSQSINYKMMNKRSKFGIGKTGDNMNSVFVFGGGSSPYDQASFKWDVFTNNSDDIYVITTNPTNVPSVAPTNPSTVPTKYPTQTPTDGTLNPTNVPTEAPTKNPTPTPTDGTLDPTNVPTESTEHPTEGATKYPTRTPTEFTLNPTKFPTKGTVNPTESTVDPTEVATKYPTQTPTYNTLPPSNTPTEGTVNPTENPMLSTNPIVSTETTINPYIQLSNYATVDQTKDPTDSVDERDSSSTTRVQYVVLLSLIAVLIK